MSNTTKGPIASAPQTSKQPRQHKQAARQQRMQNLVRTAGMLPVLLVLCIGFGFLTDGFFTL
ncbi:ribose ABC transporter permease, partial [Burkholderia sp. Bp9031]